ncbi:hypothetical protein NK6_4043 [Bradyrhizobium diazoefficiens]|uniref:Uncharacterized protein n=1 Tax=Bradyrhizobium diazoefficiens TaxID=1355477 RepID=A0A0E4BQ73_9BRAD|nr:hypothetical protein NK6_4043 [Bradyrhizobium diazoefficiens]
MHPRKHSGLLRCARNDGVRGGTRLKQKPRPLGRGSCRPLSRRSLNRAGRGAAGAA